MPEDIDKKKYGFWRLETLPIIPEKFGLKPIADSKDRFNQLKKLLHRKDIDAVINACDAGREGELIFQNLYQLSKSKLPVKRAWMQTMTAGGIQEAFRTLRDGEQMAGLADAARSRSESDWLIGINGTRAITKRMFGSRGGNVASVGRVQTPTLAIVFNRELEIRNFKPRDYWRVTAKFQVEQGTYEGVYQRPNFKKDGNDEHDRIDRVWEKATAEAALAACQGQPLAKVSEEKKSSSQASPRLYDLTTLQREANNRFGLSARRTLQIAQALYERHKVITYPRTDSRALPEDYVATCRQTIGKLPGDLVKHGQTALDNGWVRPNKRIFNNAKISDHFAIIPTGTAPAHLDEMEAKVYDMIARRFVAAFFPAAEFDVTTRISRVAQAHDFKTEGKVLTAARLAGGLWQDNGRRIRRRSGPACPNECRQRRGEDHFCRAARRDDETAAALYGSHTPFCDGARRQTGRRRRDGGGDERARTRDPRDPRRYDRWFDQPKIPRASAARARPDDQSGVAPSISFRRPCRCVDQAGHDRRMGIQAPADGARQISRVATSCRKSSR